MFLFDDEKNCINQFKFLWDYFEDNLDCLKEMYDSYIEEDGHQESNIKQARIITFVSITIEKLVLLNIYTRNPILLLSDNQISKKSLMKDCNFHFYDATWVFNHGDSFISPQDMYETLMGLVDLDEIPLNKYEGDFKFIKKIRNKYIHSFVKDVPPSTFYLVRYRSLYLIYTLLGALPSFLNIKAEKIISNFGIDDEKLELIKNFNSEDQYRKIQNDFQEAIIATQKMSDKEILKYFRRELFDEEFLDEEFPIFDHDGEEQYQQDEKGEFTILVTETQEDKMEAFETRIDCPICIKDDHSETAYIGLSNQGEEYDIDNEGDIKSYCPPIVVDIGFEYFFCTRCGCHSKEQYILENLGYADIFKENFEITWNINDGVTGFFQSNNGQFAIT